jgi:hypothetical protein
LGIYSRRIDAVFSWDDLYDIIADADVSCVEGALTFDDIARCVPWPVSGPDR